MKGRGIIAVVGNRVKLIATEASLRDTKYVDKCNVCIPQSAGRMKVHKQRVMQAFGSEPTPVPISQISPLARVKERGSWLRLWLLKQFLSILKTPPLLSLSSSFLPLPSRSHFLL